MVSEKNSSFAERLKIALQGSTASDLARQIGLSKQAISAYLNGTRHPKQPVINDISRCLNVSPAWLVGYDVPKEFVKKEVVLSDIESDHLNKFRQLNDIGKVKATSYIEGLLSSPEFTK